MILLNRRTLLGTSLAAVSPIAAFAQTQNMSKTIFDFIVVGAGTAGLPAAIFASKRGAKVLLVDAAPDVGGTLHIAGGEISGAGTHTQKAKGITDSADIHFADAMQLANGKADPNVIRLTANEAGATINWLLDNGLVPLPEHPVKGESTGRPGYSVARYLWGKNNGRDLLAVMNKELAPELASGRVVAQLNTRVSSLVTSDSGAVEGVRAQVGGQELVFRGRHVLLTAGGYAMNPEMFERLVGKPAFVAGSYAQSQGDGLSLATSIGGVLRGAELHRPGNGSILESDKWPTKVYARFNTAPQSREPWEIWVNNLGQRFVREDEPQANERESALLSQPRLRYAIVFDDAIFNAAPPGIPGWTRDKMAQHFDTHPMFVKADTLAELAKKAGIDAAGLQASVSAYNAAIKSGADPLGREHRPQAIAKAPFYAVIHHGHSATSSVGVVVDKDLRALRAKGEPIPNLYAAGEVLGSGATLGNAFVPGMMITPAMVLGRHLGMTLPLKV